MFAEEDTVIVRTPAKVNLFLEVLGERGDGYHEIRSILLPISLYDTIKIERTDGPIETVLHEDRVSRALAMEGLRPEDNLATRSAVALRAETGYAGGARIHITKRIPVGGGLGGGSADSAAVLIGLNQLWGTKVSKDRLAEIAAGQGCDIPALVRGGPALMEGRGECVTPLSFGGKNGDEKSQKSWWMVVVNPGFSVSTGDIYSRYRSPLTSPPIPYRKVVFAVEKGDVRLAAEGLFNSLESTVFAKYPLIEMTAEGLKKAGAIGVLLSGSGASVFGLAESEEHARDIEARVREDSDFSVWSDVVKTLPDGVMVAHGPLEARV